MQGSLNHLKGGKRGKNVYPNPQSIRPSAACAAVSNGVRNCLLLRSCVHVMCRV